jgi:hypothetical protein
MDDKRMKENLMDDEKMNELMTDPDMVKENKKRKIGDEYNSDAYITKDGPLPYAPKSTFKVNKKYKSVNNTPVTGNKIFGVNNTDYNRYINTDPVGGRRRRKTKRRKSKKSKRRRRSRRR